MNRAMQDVRAPGRKVRIQDKDVFAPRGMHPVLERAGLETGPVVPLQELDVQSAGPQGSHFLADQFARLVRGIIQHLYLEEFRADNPAR